MNSTYRKGIIGMKLNFALYIALMEVLQSIALSQISRRI